MRKVSSSATLVVLLIGTASACGGNNQEEDLIPITFQSKWWPQAQFIGYYAAGGHPAEGSAAPDVPTAAGANFYAEEGLDVTVLPGANDVDPSLAVAQGDADFGTDWSTNLLLAVQEKGLDLKHIAQVFQRSSFELVGMKSTFSTTDWSKIKAGAGNGKTRVGIWQTPGNELPAQVCLNSHGITSPLDEGVKEADADVETQRYAFAPSLVFPQDVDLASAMNYNELNQILALKENAGEDDDGDGKTGEDPTFENGLEDLTRFKARDEGCGLLEDMIFTSQELLDDPNFEGTGLTGREVAQRFLRATLKGWRWAINPNNQQQALQVALHFCEDFGESGSCSGGNLPGEQHQQWQLQRVREQVQPGYAEGEDDVTVGCLDDNAYRQTLELLAPAEEYDDPQVGVGIIDANIGTDIVNKDLLSDIGVVCN